MVFNATFSNISVIPWLLVLLVEETGVPIENHRPVASHCTKTTIVNIGVLQHNKDVYTYMPKSSTKDKNMAFHLFVVHQC
jgi:hypothetical protein